MEELEITGLWWLPSEPKNQIAGTLTFTAERGPILKLVGALGGVKAIEGQADIGLLHGTGEKKIVTIEGAYTRSMNIPYPGVQKHELGARRIFLGTHLEEADLVFNRVDISLDYLPEFVNRSSLVSSLHSDKSGKWKGAKAEVASQKPIKIGPVDRGQASIRFGWGQTQERFRSLTLKETCALTIDLDDTWDLEHIITEYVRPVQDLVTMATDKPNTITRLSVQNPKKIDQHISKPLTIDVYQRSNMTASSDSKKALMRHDMLFTLKDLKRSKLNKWLQVSDRFRPAVGILFGQRYSKGIHIENRLLNGVSAVEAYHRRRFTNIVLDKKDWKSKKKRIINSVDKSEVDFLNEVLQYANEKRLKTRLDEVLNHSGIAKDFIPKPDDWNKQIRGYRNVLTHYDPDSPKEIKDYEPVYWLAESLAWVMLACFMVEIGFTKKEVVSLLKENQRYIFAKTRVRELLS